MSDSVRPDVKLSFLLANWYSGATLLTLLLDRHPKLVSNGEAFYRPFRDGPIICSCGKDLRSCLFYRHAADHMWDGEDYDPSLFAVGPRLSEWRPLQRVLSSTRLPEMLRKRLLQLLPRMRRRYSEFVEAHVEFMAKAMEFAHADMYLDGTKSLRRAEMFLSQPRFASSPILLLVRDPLSWCVSWMEKRQDEAGLSSAIRTWNESIRRAFRIRTEFPSAPFRVVRYEDLCRQPGSALEGIQTWLGVEPTGISRRGVHPSHVLGNEMRHTFDGVVRPPSIKSGQLSPLEQQRILDGCGDLMKELGYSSS